MRERDREREKEGERLAGWLAGWRPPSLRKRVFHFPNLSARFFTLCPLLPSPSPIRQGLGRVLWDWVNPSDGWTWQGEGVGGERSVIPSVFKFVSIIIIDTNVPRLFPVCSIEFVVVLYAYIFFFIACRYSLPPIFILVKTYQIFE